MEELIVEAFLCQIGCSNTENFESVLNRLFLEDSANEFLLDLEQREYKDAILHLNSLIDTCTFDKDLFGKILMEKLRFLYSDMELAEFANKMYELWNLLPNSLAEENPFHILSYADDCLSYGDEKQCQELYERALKNYDN